MRQLFFIAPLGYPQVKASGVLSTHGWCAAGDDPTKDQIIGVSWFSLKWRSDVLR
jgi:hypothetical protein